MTAPVPVLCEPMQGEQQCGPLYISWHAHSIGSGWRVECTVRLGQDVQLAWLNAEHPACLLQLCDGEERCWVRLWLAMAPHAWHLMMLHGIGKPQEETHALADWHISLPHAGIANREDSICLPLPSGQQLALEWDIAGSDYSRLQVTLTARLDGTLLAAHAILQPVCPIWSSGIEASGICLEITVVLKVEANGQARLQLVWLVSCPLGDELELACLPIDAPAPEPLLPHHPPPDGVLLDSAHDFACLLYPRGVRPASAVALATRFIAIDNQGAFQSALLATPADAQAIATDYISPNSQHYPGAYVAAVAQLPPPMDKLCGPALLAVLDMRPDHASQLQQALELLLGMPLTEFVASASYVSSLPRMQDSLTALLLLGLSGPPPETDNRDGLIRALQACHIAAALASQPPWSNDALTLQSLLCASIMLPDAIPVPVSSTASQAQPGYCRPLGLAAMMTLRQRLLRYKLGALAHVENLMRGETAERGSEHRVQHEQLEHTEQANQDSEHHRQESRGDSNGRIRTANPPITQLKREFDDLSRSYSDDGLSETTTGSWTDSTSSSGQLAEQARRHAQSQLQQASNRVSRRVSTERSYRSQEEIIERRSRRLDNAGNPQHLSAVYRWIDEVYAVDLRHRGVRLVLECVFAHPAASYVARQNALHGTQSTQPTPPWLLDATTSPAGPILSAADINRDNYAALANYYLADEVIAPPPAQLVLDTLLRNDPPMTSSVQTLPPGYTISQATLAYAWSASNGQASPPAGAILAISLGNIVQAINLTAGTQSGQMTLATAPESSTTLNLAALASGVNFVVSVTLQCSCNNDAPAYLQWQMSTYQAILAAYAIQRDQYLQSMRMLAGQWATASHERRDEIERTALRQTAIEGLMAPFLARHGNQGWQQDALQFQLIPFFQTTLEWEEMIYTYYGRYFPADDAERPAWLQMTQLPNEQGDFTAFLEAGSARVLVAAPAQHGLALLYYLSSKGSFWFGPANLTPVFKADLLLANALKSPETQHPLPDSSCWEVEIATSQLMLQQGADLPNLARECGEAG